MPRYRKARPQRRFEIFAGSEELPGLILALGAGSLEMASALTALVSGWHDLGKSVIPGSNIFNLGALPGLGALPADSVVRGVRTLPPWTGLPIAAVMIPYVIVSAMKPACMGRMAMPDPLRPLAVVVLTSIGMVVTASLLVARWELSEVVLGALVPATLTGIANVVAAIQLAVQGRGPAVVSETFSSHSLNLLAGAGLPTLFPPIGTISPIAQLILWCLFGTTPPATLLFLRNVRLNRIGGGVPIAAYAGVVVLPLR